LNDQWIADLSVSNESRNIRTEIFNSLLKNGEPKVFTDYRTGKDKYTSFFKWEDVAFISSKSKIFSSSSGYMINDISETMPFTGSLLSMDGEEHRQKRSIISSVFSKKNITNLENIVREISKKTFENVLSNKDEYLDIYDNLCLQVPLEVNRFMMGFESSDNLKVLRLTKYIVGNEDPEYGNLNPIKWLSACNSLEKYARNLAEDKIANPSEDLTSLLVNSREDSGKLSEKEFAQLFILLVVAGMETTTHALNHGIHFLNRNPEQKELLKSNFNLYIKPFIEEVLRLEPVAYHFRRTATEDAEVNDTEVKKGDRLVMWYNTANRDPDKFKNPNTFDLTRSNTFSHTSFGGPGLHYCIGAQLARMEMEIFFEHLFEYMPDIRIDDMNTSFVRSRWGNGYKKCYGNIS
jgi:methyl-branched lipid omega-hydroxylase